MTNTGPQIATLAGAPLFRRLGVPLHVAHYRGGDFEVHYHSFLELVIVNADGGFNVVGGRRTPFRRRQVYHLGMFHPHRVESPAGGHCDYFNITFHPEVAMAPHRTARSSPEASPPDVVLAPFYAALPAAPELLPEDDYRTVAAICGALIREIAQPDRRSATIAPALFQGMIEIIARRLANSSGSIDSRVQAVLRTIAERFHEPLPTRELAAGVGLSASRLDQVFREHTGTTIRRALLRRRLTEAKRLLATTDVPITEVLHSCGFNDVSYFNRSFRADTGTTPRGFRRSAG